MSASTRRDLLRSRLFVPPPPPPPPLPPMFFDACDPSVRMGSIRDSLCFDSIGADDTGNFALTRLQYNILFVGDDDAPRVAIDSAKVSLLQIAGQVALWKESSNCFMKQLGIDLFPRLQAMAAPHSKMKARQYHEAQLVRLLSREVVLRMSNSEIHGVFEGCAKVGDSKSQLYKVQVRGNEPHEAVVNLDSICSGAVEMRAVEKTDPPAY